jgi:hypothetical protein
VSKMDRNLPRHIGGARQYRRTETEHDSEKLPWNGIPCCRGSSGICVEPAFRRLPLDLRRSAIPDSSRT